MPSLARHLIREPLVVTIIGLNAVVLFLDAFPGIHRATYGVLFWIDYACMVYFVLEAILKVRAGGFAAYWRSGWNRFDFLIVLGSLPLLAGPFLDAGLEEFAVLLLLRLGRLLRFTRLMRFVPNAADVWRGVGRALKASVAVFLILFLLNLVLAMGATFLFGEHAPEYFGDPLRSLYALFKVFTVEGWYEIPDALAERGGGGAWVTWLRLYFIMAVLIGGILGLSLANAIFVDELTVDNTDRVEEMIAALQEDLARFRQEVRAGRTDLPSGPSPPGT